MAEQTITLESSWFTNNVGTNGNIVWAPPQESKPEIDSSLVPSGVSRFLRTTSLFETAVGGTTAGTTTINFDPTQSTVGVADLSDAFENTGSLEFTLGSYSVLIPMEMDDTVDPYSVVNNTSEVIAFVGNVKSLGGSQNATLILRDFVPAAPAFADDTGAAFTGTVGEAITDITVPEATGMPAPTYAVEGALPAGLQFDTTTRVISGTPQAAGSGTITIRATNPQGTADWTVDYTFSAALAAPAFADDTGTPISGMVNTAITSITVPEASGNPTPTYAVVGSLPGGLDFDTGTRVLSGTPDTVGSGTITIRATNSEGSDDWTVAYAFTPALAAPVFADDTGDLIEVFTGNPITPVTVPEATGNPTPTYAVVGILPGGIMFDTATRVLSGTPNEFIIGTIRIRATNSEGSDDWTVQFRFTSEFSPPHFAGQFGTPISGLINEAITPVTIPRAEDGRPDPTYELLGTAPSGLMVTLPTTDSDGEITGTPDVAASGTIRIRAMNSQGSAEWDVVYSFAEQGMKAVITPSVTTVEIGNSVTLDAEAYGDLIAVDRGGGQIANVELWSMSQASDGTWILRQRGGLSGLSGLSRVITIATHGGDFFTMDRFGEDIFRITNLDTGAGVLLGTEGDSDLDIPQGSTFLGDVYWIIDEQNDDLWSWADVINSPDGGVQRGTVTLTGNPRALTVRDGNLVILAVDGRDWRIVRVDDTTTGASTVLATFTGVPTAPISGNPEGMEEYRGSPWLITTDAELVEITGIGGTPAYQQRADFDDSDLNEPYGLTQYPMPASYAWASDSGGTFGDAAALSTTWDSTGATSNSVVLTLTVTDEAGNTTSRSVTVAVTGELSPPEPVAATFSGLAGSLTVSVTVLDVAAPEPVAATFAGVAGSFAAPAVMVREAQGSPVEATFQGVAGSATAAITLVDVADDELIAATFTGVAGSATAALDIMEVGDHEPVAATFTGVAGSATVAVTAVSIIEIGLSLGGTLTGSLSIAPVLNETIELPTLALGGTLTGELSIAPVLLTTDPIADTEAYARGQARALAGVSPRYALEITHPDIADPVRIVADNTDHIIESNRYIALAFAAEPPQFREGEIPRATLQIDNVGRELTRWVEATGGGRGAKMRVMMVHKDTSGDFSHIVWELPALAVGVTELTNEMVTAQLVFRSGKSRPGIKMRQDPRASPGLFQ